MILVLAVIFYSNLPFLAYSDDNLELLSTSLRKLERAACDQLSLSCPQGTSISLLSAKYSQGVLCPGSITACQLPSSLQTAVERCQKKRHCRIQPSTNSFVTDPCPGVSKHMHIVYNCRPYEFRSKTACEKEVVQLQCGPNSRIAVYSASYGRTQYESVECPQPQGVPEETCLAGYATETVIQFCHGKRRCALSVDSKTFGSPCRKHSRLYLKVVYNCVPRQVLLPKFEQRQELDETVESPDEWLDYEEEGLAAPNTIGQHNASSTTNESVTLHHNRADITPTGSPNDEVKVPSSTYRLFVVLMASGSLFILLFFFGRIIWATYIMKPPPITPPPRTPPFAAELFENQVDLTAITHNSNGPSEVVRFPTTPPPRSLAADNSQYYFG